MAVSFARELAAICRAEAAEADAFDPAHLPLLEALCAPGKAPHYYAYQALSEERAEARQRAARGPGQAAYLRELASCLERGAPSARLLALSRIEPW